MIYCQKCFSHHNPQFLRLTMA